MILDQFRLDGKVALVTGTSRGLGQGSAVALAEAGADVALLDRSLPTETIAKVEALGRRVHSVRRDSRRRRRTSSTGPSRRSRRRSAPSTSSSTTRARSAARPPPSTRSRTGTRCSP